MGRSRSSAVDDLLAVFAAVPWWVAEAAAAVSWFTFSLSIARFACGVLPHHIVIAVRRLDQL